MKVHLTIRKKILVAMIVFALGIIFYGSGETEKVPENKQLLSVSVITAVKTQKSNQLWLTGTVEGFTSSIISSKYSDQIKAIYVENGQRVRRGENLLKVDTDELENNLRLAKSDLKKATVNNENVKANYNRKRKLFDVGAISKETLELAAVQLKTSIAETEDAETKMQIAQKKLFDATVTSPVNGVIANKKVNVGQIVSAGSQLMTVEEIDSVYVTVKVEQQFISEVQIGTNAQIKTDAFPDKNFTGKVAVINPVAGAESRLFEVKISVDNPDFILMPGMFTEVLIDEDKKSIMLTVPRSAVISRKGQNYVYVLDKNSDTVKRQRVEIGELLDENIEIISGISEGDEIVTDNIDKLKDGDAVNVYGGGGN